MSETELDLRALLEAATPGPWRTFPDGEGGVWGREGYGMAATGCGQGNAALIAALRNEAAALLDDRDRLRALEAGVEAMADTYDKERWRAWGIPQRLRWLLATRPDNEPT